MEENTVNEKNEKEMKKTGCNKASGAIEVSIESRIKRPDYTFSYKLMGTAPKGDIIAIKAKSKNGKTFLSSLLAAVTLGAKIPGFKSNFSDSKVIYFDTEQNLANTFSVVSRVYTMCEWELVKNDRITAYNMREMDIDKRIGFIQDKITELKPTSVFIDGIADLLLDFNDIAISQGIIQRMMKISSYNKCAIFIIIHTNKGKGDDSMKGHLGTICWQKCSDVFNVEKQKDKSFLVTETDCRNKPISRFFFKISKDGIPYLPKKHNESIQEDEDEKLLEDEDEEEYEYEFI